MSIPGAKLAKAVSEVGAESEIEIESDICDG